MFPWGTPDSTGRGEEILLFIVGYNETGRLSTICGPIL